MIPARVGKQVGGNLFQSFTQFDLSNTQSATFTGPSNVQNILSRVTGGSPSSIDGKVSSQITGANLFFLNPAGVMFGPHAQLDVSGSVAISTANYVRLADSGKFNTSLGGGDVLTSAPVSSFGFLNSTPARVSIASGNTVDAAGTLFLGSDLTAGLTGNSFSVVAGKIALNGAYIGAFSGSRVNLVSVGSSGEVQLDATDINSAVDVTQFAKLGEIDLNAAYLNTSQLAGGPGGPVVIRGESFFMDRSSQIFSDTRGGSVQGGTIDIALTQTVKISNLSNIETEPVFSGHSGNIFIKAQSILLDNECSVLTTGLVGGDSGDVTVQAKNLTLQNSFLRTDALDTGNGGNVTIDAAQSVLLRGSDILTDIEGIGHGGDVIVNAGSVILNNASRISSTTGATGPTTGKAGDITIHTNNLQIVSGSIDASTFDRGHAGNISITAKSLSIEAIDLDRPFAGSIDSRTIAQGDAGNITIRTTELELANGALIDTSTSGDGNGGNIRITTDSLSIAGANSFNPSEISAATSGAGNGGNVIIDAAHLMITSGGQISASTIAQGRGGNVTTTSDALLVDGSNSGIFAVAGHPGLGSSGIGGDVAVSADELSLQNGGTISAASFTSAAAGSVQLSLGTLNMDSGSSISSANTGSGPAGGLFIDTSELMKLEGGSSISTSAINGSAGTITVNAADLTIIDGSDISSSTFGRGNGGNVNVTANSLFIDGSNSGIFAVAGHAGLGSSGIGGDVAVSADELSLQNGGTISAASFTSAAAGSVDLSLGRLRMNSGSSISSANTGSGPAGSIFIDTTGSVTLRRGSSISVASRLSNAGGIDLFSDRVIKLSSGSSITASAGTDGGNIHLKALDLVYLKDSSITAEAGREQNGTRFGGTGGNIAIGARFIILKDSVISANAAAGQGGNINLVSDLFLNSDSLITATGTTNNGTINITGPNLDLGAELITLPNSLVSAETQLQERCTALLRGDFSSFITVGRGGTEPAPDELQSEF
jgi:filamentous hemagglutinin family protein